MLWDITFSLFHRYLVCFPECIALWLVLLLRRFLILSEMRVVEGMWWTQDRQFDADGIACCERHVEEVQEVLALLIRPKK